MAFNKEDKICWEELSPSLQDKFKSLQNLIDSQFTYLSDRSGDVRLTIGPEPPELAIEYAELWFDTNIMALRAYAHHKWSITRAAWYLDSASSVKSTTEANLSSNERTNCHCYTINYILKNYCHCKTQLWDSSVLAIGSESKVSFNKNIEADFKGSTQYRLIFITSKPSVTITGCNFYAEGTQGNIVPSHEDAQRVLSGEGVYKDFCTFDEKYDPLFDTSNFSSYVLTPGTTIIPLEFVTPQKFTSVHCSLIPYSDGPVTVRLQVNNSGFITIFEKTLSGDPVAYSTCHGSCHCRTWIKKW